MTPWCDTHGVGYVATIAIRSKMLHDAMDAHGHEIDLARHPCETCREASASDGYCLQCRFGFVEQLVYFSPLTYCVARGRIETPDTIECATCKKHSQSAGWCDTCQVGRVGSLALDDPALFATAQKAFEHLTTALTHLERCKVCCTAAFTGGACRFCERSFPAPPRPAPPPAGADPTPAAAPDKSAKPSTRPLTPAKPAEPAEKSAEPSKPAQR